MSLRDCPFYGMSDYAILDLNVIANDSAFHSMTLVIQQDGRDDIAK